VAKHISAEVHARNNRTFTARRRRGKHASSTTQAVFRGVRAKWLYENPIPRLAVQFSSVQFSSVAELRVQLWNVN
jgi:hypothetical protein